MTAEIPPSNPEKKELLDDNALKFTLEGLPHEFLQESEAIPFLLTTDWLQMGEQAEKKLAHKQYPNGETKILLIQKFTDESGKRTLPPKQELSHEQYLELLEQSIQHVVKTRYEFNYSQNGTQFSMKYDEFADSALRMLEVDAEDEPTRESFDSGEFPYELTSVTGQIEYYGYRVAQVL